METKISFQFQQKTSINIFLPPKTGSKPSINLLKIWAVVPCYFA
jgi:hypothetical protein